MKAEDYKDPAAAAVEAGKQFVAAMMAPPAPAPDMVNKPPHYRVEGLPECIEVIEKLGFGFHLGNTLKYMWRAGRKDDKKTIEDLEKAAFYLKRHIANLKGTAKRPGDD